MLLTFKVTNIYFFGVITVNCVKMIVHCKAAKKAETDACKLEQWEIWHYTSFVLVLIFVE